MNKIIFANYDNKIVFKKGLFELDSGLNIVNHHRFGNFHQLLKSGMSGDYKW